MEDTTDKSPPKDGASQVDGLMGVFESAQRTMEKAGAALKAEVLESSNEFLDAVNLARERNAAFRTKLAGFRGFLGISTNFPPAGIADGTIDRGRAEDAQVVEDTKPAGQ